jgi:PAS domain S-box-containing protein
VAESLLEELRRYVGFGPADEAALRDLAPHAQGHFAAIAEEFYDRLAAHDEARQVFSGPEQVARLKGTLQVWMRELCCGPWDEAYYQRRLRIGRRHVTISLPQRYMFAAMDVIRIALAGIANDAYDDDHDRRMRAIAALHRILDIELAIMLESYRDAFVDQVQMLERTEKMHLERQLAVSQARYDEIVETGEALITTIDPDGHIVLFNAKCEEATGIRRSEAAGRRWLDLFVSPPDRDEVALRQRQVMAGEASAPYEGPMAAGTEGTRVRWTFTALPGTEALVCAIGIDVTEAHDLAVRTQRAERLASLGAMAAGLAHEIRNPLNAAHLQLSVAQRRLLRGGEEGILKAVELADGEIARLAGLVQDFLQFARPQPLRLVRTDLRGMAQATLALLAPEAAAAGVSLTLEPGQEVWAEVDRERMTQVLLNLVRNALEAAGTGGHVRLAVDRSSAGARLVVEDDGRGFASDAPIFEPFFTTKEQGTGLGLAIVHRIVSDHAGKVEVETRPGRTAFTLTVPVTSG